jgi:hypothetical protein
MTERDDPRPPAKRRKPPIGQSIGGVLFGFEQQVWRNQPPPHELVHHARPDDPVPADDGGSLTIEMPPMAALDDQTTAHDDHDEGASSVPELDSGAVGRRPPPVGFPAELPRPPIVAEPGDPFSSIRVVDAFARMDRGRAVRLDDLVDRLNATHLDWLFTREVVVDVLVALQANWMADYRNSSGIVLDDGDRGPVVILEDSPRVDPWLVQQARRQAEACREALDAFARRDSPFASG